MKITFYVAVGLAGLALGGCGYKPLDAPCSMDEGGGPAQSSKLEIAPTVPVAPADTPIQALSYAEPAAVAGARAVPSVRGGDCGPLRPINAGTLR